MFDCRQNNIDQVLFLQTISFMGWKLLGIFVVEKPTVHLQTEMHLTKVKYNVFWSL